MLVKINGDFVYIYKYNSLWKFELKGECEPYLTYLAIDNNLKYYAVDEDDEYSLNMPQRKIRRYIKKLYYNK